MTRPLPARSGFLRRWRDRALERWLYGRAPDTVPLTLGQRRIYILPSGAGLGFAATLATMLLAAVNYDLGLGYAVVFLLAGVGTLGMGLTYRNLAGLTLTAGPTGNGMAGTTLGVVLRASQRRSEPRPGLGFGFAPTDGDGPTAWLDLAAGSDAEVVLPLAAPKRGPLPIPPIRVESRYPLGLFTAWSIWRPTVSALVYPAPADPAPPLPPQAAGSGARPTRRTQAGNEDFAGLRPRTPADPLRHVAWKLVARQGDGERRRSELPLKQFESDAAGELWLRWEDVPPPATGLAPEQALEERLAVLCAWVLAADALDAPYGLRLPGTALPPSRGEAHREACLARLALFGFADDGVPATMPSPEMAP